MAVAVELIFSEDRKVREIQSDSLSTGVIVIALPFCFVMEPLLRLVATGGRILPFP